MISSYIMSSLVSGFLPDTRGCFGRIFTGYFNTLVNMLLILLEEGPDSYFVYFEGAHCGWMEEVHQKSQFQWVIEGDPKEDVIRVVVKYSPDCEHHPVG